MAKRFDLTPITALQGPDCLVRTGNYPALDKKIGKEEQMEERGGETRRFRSGIQLERKSTLLIKNAISQSE